MKNTYNYTKTSLTKRLSALLLALLMAFMLGCGNAGESAASEDMPEMNIDVPMEDDIPDAVTGGEIRMYIPENADIADPLMVNTEEMLAFYSLIYESLIAVNADGKLAAELAESWNTEDGGKTWTIHLRSGVTWHGGEKAFSARDALHTYERLVGLGEDSYYSFCTNRIESMELVDNTTLTVTMKTGGYSSLYALTFPITMDGGVPVMPIGTGPYCSNGYRNDNLELIANENWWKQRAYIDRITLLERSSNDIALASYNAGQLDFVPTSTATAGKYRQEKNTAVLDVMTQSVEIMLVNGNSKTLNTQKMRQAIAYALDRSKIISNIYMNRAQAVDAPIAPDSWIYESKSKIYDYNETKALQLLAEEGWTDIDEDGKLEKNGLAFSEMNLQLLVNDSADGARKNAAASIADQLEDIGINVEVITVPYSISGNSEDYPQMLKDGQYDVALMGLNLGRDFDLTEIMAADGSANYGNYYDNDLYTLANKMITAGDEAAYRDAAFAFQLAFAEKLPFIPLYFRLNSIVYSTEIKGMTDVREPDIMRTVDKWYIYTEDTLVQDMPTKNNAKDEG